MSKVSSKYQISLPRDLARSHGIFPGEELVVEEAGSALYLRREVPVGGAAETAAAEKVQAFDRASQRQVERDLAYAGSARPSDGRGWTRDELYQRG